MTKLRREMRNSRRKEKDKILEWEADKSSKNQMTYATQHYVGISFRNLRPFNLKQNIDLTTRIIEMGE